jgi:hypothetical protein
MYDGDGRGQMAVNLRGEHLDLFNTKHGLINIVV